MLKLRVLESSAFIAAPLAGLTLAQFGADVIRVDMIGGGIDYGRLPLMPSGRSLYWTGLNRGKRSIAVDLRRPEGRELVRNLAAADGDNAGVLLTNIPTPWLSHEALAAIRPDMISCTIEGNPDGSTAVDYTVNCATGFPLMTGHGSLDAPINHALPAWDVACAYQAAFAIVAAVNRRMQDGQGAEMRLALADMAFASLSNLGLTAEAELLQFDRPAIGNYTYGAFGRDFATADGERVMVAGISAGQWTSLVKACEAEPQLAKLGQNLGLDLNSEAGRYEAREAIAAVFEPWIGARPLAEVRAVFDRNRVCWGQYRTTRGLLADDPRVSLENPVWERIDTPGIGNHLSAGTPVRAKGEARTKLSPAAILGQHTDEVLLDVLGLGSAAVGKLHDDGVVAGPECDRTMASANARA